MKKKNYIFLKKEINTKDIIPLGIEDNTKISDSHYWNHYIYTKIIEHSFSNKFTIKKAGKIINNYEREKIYQKLENLDKKLELLVGIGLNYQKLGNLEQMAGCLEKALEVTKYLENRKEEARILVDLGEAYFHRGNLEPSNACLDRAEEILNFLCAKSLLKSISI